MSVCPNSGGDVGNGSAERGELFLCDGDLPFLLDGKVFIFEALLVEHIADVCRVGEEIIDLVDDCILDGTGRHGGQVACAAALGFGAGVTIIVIARSLSGCHAYQHGVAAGAGGNAAEQVGIYVAGGVML